MTTQIRDFQSGDESAAFYICMKTGDHGNDGEPFFGEDPDALGRIYVDPYLRFAAELALMLEDDEGVCGYALGALDSRGFYERYDNELRPNLMRQFPAPTGDSKGWSRLESVYHSYHDDESYCPEPYDDYPSHLHIDLLPRAQGHGHGRRMMERLMDLLRQRGSVGVHLGMSVSNEPAYGFYKRLGFVELCRVNDTIYMGIKL